MSSGPTLRRRALLAGAAGAAAATGGCVGELRNLAGRDRYRQLSLSIATVPAGHDAHAVRVANALRENLERAGVDAAVAPTSPDVLRRDVLVNHDFDVYVGRYPSEGRPDELRTLLHSTYGEEAGWQNPFGFSSVAVDELLAEQRAVAGEERAAVVGEIQERAVELQPFTVVAFADRIAAAQPDRFDGWPAGGPARLSDYLRAERAGDDRTLRAALGDVRPTRNRNPLAVEHRGRSRLTDLLYEPLVRRPAGSPVPWLARTVEWETDPLAATVTLRETPWHDGRPVAPSDVAFTYAFLADTSLGGMDTPVPTPRRRGAVSLVDDAAVVDGAVRLAFATDRREVARRALSVPILPEHVWREHTGAADLAGIDVAGGRRRRSSGPTRPPSAAARSGSSRPTPTGR